VWNEPIIRQVNRLEPVCEGILTVTPPLREDKDFFVSNPREHSDMISGRLDVGRVVQPPAILHHTAIDMDVTVHNALRTNRLNSISHGLGMVHPNCCNS
jgi:hypothetical protein